MDLNSSSEFTRINPEERLEARIRRICKGPRNSPPKTDFLENIWPELEESYGMMVKALVEYWKRRLHKDGILAMVEGRQKSAESISMSMDRREQDRLKRSAGPYKSLEEIFNDVHDLAGIRIVVDFTPRVTDVVGHIKRDFKETKDPSDWRSDRLVGQLWTALFGAYQGSNHPVKFDSGIDVTLQRYSNVTVEIQVTSLAESLYNRLAHPLLYKKDSGTLSRKEEMVIDLSHGLALCYSICLLLMQDKLEQPIQSPEKQKKLRNAMREAGVALGKGELDNLAALVDQTLGSKFHDLSHQISNEIEPASSAEPVLPVGRFLDTLQNSRAEKPPPGQLWESLTNTLKNAIQEAAIQEATKSPILLPTCGQARFDSEDVQSRPKCLQGTQNDARSRIKAWAKDSQAPILFWLHGLAGTGKSTLARTIIDDLSKDGNLAAGYFFRRGDEKRNSVSRIFPTIAIQLSETLPPFEPLLRKSTNARSSETILQMSLERQFEILLEKPLSGMAQVSPDRPPMVIIIDGLDECDAKSRLKPLLRLLASLGAMKCLRLCVLITSRKRLAISRAFEDLQTRGQCFHSLALLDEYKVQMTADIRQYLTSEFRDIKQKKGIQIDPWPTQEDFDLLFSQATTPSPLFIYASTLIRFVDQTKPGCEPTAQLQNWVLGCQRKVSRLDEMYTQILWDIAKGDPKDESKLMEILGSIASLARPLSAKALEALLDIPVSELLKDLQTVLYVPDDDEEAAMLTHESFRDFLFRDPQPGNTSFRISESNAHRVLATKCLDRMIRPEGGLRKDPCNFSKLTIEWNDIPPGVVGDRIPIDLQYACLYWVHHLEKGKHVDQKEIFDFLAQHFLHWVETLSLLRSVSQVQDAVKDLERLVKEQGSILKSYKLVSFMNDAKSFVDNNAEVMKKMPLQVYGSTLVFSPPGSKVRQLFYDGCLTQIHHMKSGYVDWDTLSQGTMIPTKKHPPPQDAKTSTGNLLDSFPSFSDLLDWSSDQGSGEGWTSAPPNGSAGPAPPEYPSVFRIGSGGVAGSASFSNLAR